MSGKTSKNAAAAAGEAKPLLSGGGASYSSPAAAGTPPAAGTGPAAGRRPSLGSRSHSKRQLQLFIDPAPVKISGMDSPPSTRDKTKFKYLEESRLRLWTGLLKKQIQATDFSQFFAAILVVLAIAVDGVRPISLFWAKGGQHSYPFMFSTWLVLVKFMVVVFSVVMLYTSRREDERAAAQEELGPDGKPLPVVDETGVHAADDEELLPEMSVGRKACLSIYLIPPTVLYVASDLLNFFAFELVSPTTFSVIRQSRLIITAILFRVVLQRAISSLQWVAILQLFAASLLFVAADSQGKEVTETTDEEWGIMIVVIKCFLDSLATVLMDHYFKKLDRDGVRLCCVLGPPPPICSPGRSPTHPTLNSNKESTNSSPTPSNKSRTPSTASSRVSSTSWPSTRRSGSMAVACSTATTKARG